MFSFTFGGVAFGELPVTLNRAVADPFVALLRDPYAQLVYLVELEPYDTSQSQMLTEPLPFGDAAFGEFQKTYYGGLTTVYLSDCGFVSRPDDNPSSVYFDQRLDNPLQYETSIMAGDQFGSANQSFGALSIINGDGGMDRLNRYFWPGRRVVIKAGSPNFRYTEFATVFNGSANGIEVDDERITITVQDNRLKLDQLLIPGIYAGTGGLQGGPDLANKTAPLCYGVVNNLEPVLVDAANLIYQIHDGSINSITAVRDNGVALMNGGTTTNIQTVMVFGGSYVADLTKGYIKLGGSPAGRITVDATGENGNGGYVSAVGDIIGRIVKTRMGVFSLTDTDINTGSLNRLNLAVPGPVGLYINERTSASSIIESLISPIGGYWNFSRQGQLSAGIINPPGMETYTITADDIDDAGVRILSTINPSWRVSVGYAPSVVVQPGSELAGGTSAAVRAFVSQDYRYVTAQDDLVYTYNPQASDRVFRTQLANLADAQALLTRLMSIYSRRRRVYQVPIYRALFRLYVGDTVKLVYDRFDLSAGANLLIVGIAEDAETGLTTLQLWG